MDTENQPKTNLRETQFPVRFEVMTSTETMVSDTLREAIRSSGKTCCRISREAGASESQLSRFMNHRGGLSLSAFDLLCRYLELDLTSRGPK